MWTELCREETASRTQVAQLRQRADTLHSSQDSWAHGPSVSFGLNLSVHFLKPTKNQRQRVAHGHGFIWNALFVVETLV